MGAPPGGGIMQKKPATSKKYEIVTQCVDRSGNSYYDVRLLRKIVGFPLGYVFSTTSQKNLSQIGDARGFTQTINPGGRSVITGGTPVQPFGFYDMRYYRKICNETGALRINSRSIQSGIFRYYRS